MMKTDVMWKHDGGADEYAAALKCCEDTLSSLEPSFCSDGSDSGEFTPRVPIKTYGPNVEVYISRSLKPAGAGSALTSTPIDGGNAGRAGSPARGVHFSPVVSEVNWRESYVEPDGGDKVAATNTNNTTAAKSASSSSSSSSTAGIGRRSRKISAEDSADLPQRVKVTTTEGNKLSVQKIQVTSVAPTSESVSIFVATLPPPERQQQQQHEEPSASPLPPSVMNGNKSATLPAKLKPVKPPKPDDASTHVSIWKRLGIGRLSFGKSGKSSKQQHQQQQQPSPPPPNKVATKEVIQPEPVPIHATPTKSTSQEMPEPTSTERNESLSESPGKKDVLATSESPSPSPPQQQQQQQNKSDALPPRPPNQASKHLSPVARARLISARKHFLATQGAAQKPPSTSSGPLTAEEAAKSSENLRVAFERFRQKAEEDRRRLAQSVPDLQEVESSVRSAIELKHRQDALLDEEAPPKEERKTVSAAMTARKNDMMRSSQEFDDRWREILAKSEIKKYGDRLQRASQARSSFSSDITDATARPGNARYHNHHGKRMHQYSTAAQFFNDRHRSKSVSANDDNDPSGLDSGEVLFLRETHLGRLDGGSGGGQPVSSPGGGVDGGHVRHVSSPESMKARSMVNLGDDVDDDDEDGPRLQRLSPSRGGEDSSRAKSMEFLLDDENKQKIKPPENELMKEDRQMSEHELRFQQSLQRLNVPEWYKKSQQQRKQSADSGLITRPRRAMDRVLPGGWEETKTSSMSSLQSSRANTPTKGRPIRPIFEWRYGSSRDNVMSPDSTTSSPVPSERGGGGGSSTGGGGAYQPFRWGVGRLSGSASPCSQFSIGAASFSGRTLLSSAASTTAAAPARRPYLGWRSQEKLGKLEAAEQHLHNNRQIPPAPPAYLSPAERMAKELLAAQRQKQEEAKVQANGLTLSPSEVPHLSPRMVRNSIKEVTNAIVHYCSESDDDHFTPPRRTLNAVSPDEETPVTVVRHQRRPPTAAPKPGVWVESSFVGEKPIQSPRTPPVGDVATLLEAELLNGSDDLGSPSSLSSYDVKLVPIEKLRTGSAQLDTFFGKRELRRPTVGNGELWLQ